MVDLLHKDLSELVIKAYYKVYNTLGYGFLEKVYENAFTVELGVLGLEFKVQHPIDVFYRNHKVGLYYADIVVEDTIIVELKAAETLCDEHECQLLNYLKGTNMEVGLLFNFGKKPQFKRLVFSNKRKAIR